MVEQVTSRGARRSVTALAIFAGLVAMLTPTGVAWAAGTAAVSDTSPAPGQVITATGSGLQPGAPVLIDLFGDGVRLGEFAVGADGTFAQDVQIPPGTSDGSKGVKITTIDADGKYASFSIYITVSGPPAEARLSTSAIRPGQVLRVSGTRFRPGGEIYVVLFPEEVLLGTPIASGDGSFATDVRMPDDLLNGEHGIVVAGASAGGSFAYLVLEASGSGGSGFVPSNYSVPRNHPLAGGAGAASEGSAEGARAGGGSSVGVSSTSSIEASTTVRKGAVDQAQRDPVRPTSDQDPAVVLFLCLAVAGLLAVAVAWSRSSEGRRWWRKQRRGSARGSSGSSRPAR